ncbi:isocitrate lyase/PEP mutase family protein [Marinicauda algicola]|uniref:2-methylisocitrate lyase n=1 Tax=Marinicauda algicola TaxID=2029849 RepID=A0A4S2H3L5_9PROT|nr:isocitrate lyase/PEP mutase family protein [Marinicauda algicola]TGY90166.1 isocitrate lyase/PEP mutase family protein [Marinicauda algicola]
MTSLKTRLAEGPAVLAPGVYDALSALLVEQAGFEAAYLSGASIAYTQLGRPDLGLVTASEVADVIARIRERTGIPLVVDADTGFGNALNVQRTVEMFERAGASAIQIEDQNLPKRCGHLAGKSLVSPEEMAGKVRAAVDARKSRETLIIARTDAIAVEGFEAALERAEAYLAAGADMLFVEAPRSAEELSAIARRFKSRVPLLANMVEGGRTPMRTLDQLDAQGFRFVITPGAMVRALAFMAREFLSGLKQTGSTAGYRERMLDFDGLNALLGLPEMKEKGARYDADRKDAAE